MRQAAPREAVQPTITPNSGDLRPRRINANLVYGSLRATHSSLPDTRIAWPVDQTLALRAGSQADPTAERQNQRPQKNPAVERQVFHAIEPVVASENRRDQ